jgi:hypothetical protein
MKDSSNFHDFLGLASESRINDNACAAERIKSIQSQSERGWII